MKYLVAFKDGLREGLVFAWRESARGFAIGTGIVVAFKVFL